MDSSQWLMLFSDSIGISAVTKILLEVVVSSVRENLVIIICSSVSLLWFGGRDGDEVSLVGSAGAAGLSRLKAAARRRY